MFDEVLNLIMIGYDNATLKHIWVTQYGYINELLMYH